jgi:MarR family transcriptional regulator, organic hydroperoxide resistance regulator
MAKVVPAADLDPLSLERQVCLALTHPQYLVMLALWDNAKAGGAR